MQFIFWQNLLSLHQSSFIKALSDEHDVTLVVVETIDEQRRQEKWTVPSMGNARIIVAPDGAVIESLLDVVDAHHVFSGINAFPMIYKAFKGAVRRGRNVSVVAEPYDWLGLKGTMRRFMYSFLFLRYGRNISHFFATGERGIQCYLRAGFPASKLHHWGYFTEPVKSSDIMTGQISDNRSEEADCELVNLLFVGRVDANKNIIELLKGFNIFGSNVNKFTVVGDGPLMDELKALAERDSRIVLLGRLGNEDAKNIMSMHDYLVLPSIYDGWGAVVNEALGVGTAVICSDTCGASVLLDGVERGRTFTMGNMYETIKECCSDGPINRNRRIAIARWASQNISGQAAARYFVDILKGKKIKAPWV